MVKIEGQPEQPEEQPEEKPEELILEQKKEKPPKLINEVEMRDRNWCIAEVQKMTQEFITRVKELKTILNDLMDLRDKINIALGSNDLSRKQIIGFVIEFEDINDKIGNAMSEFSQSKSPFKSLFEAIGHGGFRGPEGSLIISKENLEKLAFKFGHQFGNTAKGVFNYGFEVKKAIETKRSRSKDVLLAMRDCINNQEPNIKRMLQFLENHCDAGEVYYLLGLPIESHDKNQ